MIKTYEIHPSAGLVPMASEAEQVALNLDIKENGLKNPIVLWQGKIIDGRCRQIGCIYAGERIRVTELDDELTEDEVRITVKSLNTRRNLTTTQKTISAVKEKVNKTTSLSIGKLAEAWGISKPLLDNAIFIQKHAPQFIDPLFNGHAVSIINSKGEPIDSNKVSTVYTYVKRQQENVTENTEHGWGVDNTNIKTQVGKDWFNDLMRTVDVADIHVTMLLQELANYKFPKGN